MSEVNNNFEDLKRLLKLKRHEVPPPGFFNHFSSDVISRIRAGEARGGQSFLERLQGDSPFMAALLQLFAAKPGAMGALATSVCLLLLVGVLFMDTKEPAASAPTSNFLAQAAAATPEPAPTLASDTPLAAPDSSIAISTNPISSLQPVSTLFGSPQNALFQNTGFVPASQ
jgi:hypothetical protein